MAWETFFLKNHTQHLEEKLFPNNFLKVKNWSYLWINGLKFYTVFYLACQVADHLLSLMVYKTSSKKQNKRSGTSCMIFEENISFVKFY